MLEVIIGNICSLGAAISDSVSGTRNTKLKILIWQTISQCFYIVSSLVLKGYSATVQNVVAVFRNLYAAKGKKNQSIDVLLVIVPLVLGIAFNNRGLLGLIPVIGNLEYGVVVLFFEDNPRKLKIAFAICCGMFVIFNFAILNFVGGCGCIVVVISTVASIIKEKKTK